MLKGGAGRAAEWGDSVIEQLAAYLARTQPGLRGFTLPNLFRNRKANPESFILTASLDSILREIARWRGQYAQIQPGRLDPVGLPK